MSHRSLTPETRRLIEFIDMDVFALEVVAERAVGHRYNAFTLPKGDPPTATTSIST